MALAIGNLYPVKGHRFLIEALAQLRERQPHLHVAIGGRGGEEAALRELAEALGVRDHVHLLGLRSDVPELLAAADMFVMPSLNEGLPMALLEAMCASTTIIASAVGAIPEVLEHGSGGILVSPGNANELANAIERLLSSPEESTRMAKRARVHAMAEFSVDRMVERYIELYEKCVR